ncbi:hypothetical protein ACW6QP_00030 [Salegentibacter sp. HM20]
MKKIFVLFSAVLLAACGGAKKISTAPEDKYLLENLANATSAQLAANYADANIYEDTGLFEEGTIERPYTVLYRGTPDEIQITWNDAARTEIHDITFSGNGKWHSATGIKVGTTYEELERLNGREISFYGFGWDYGGAVMWNNGDLESTNVQVFLEPANDPANKFYGDHLVDATPEEIEALNLRVKTIMYLK